MRIWIYTFISVVVVSLISLIGVFFLSLSKERLKNILLFLVSFSVGALFGDAFIHLLPETFEKLGTNLSSSLYIVMGILLFFILEKFIRWRHCHVPTSKDHPHPVVAMNLIGDGIHNLIDGMLIGASFCISTSIGVTTSLAVILHEIPQEIGDFGVLIHGGLSARKALLFNFFSGLTAVLGAVLSLLIGPHIAGYATALLPVTAGGFLYIAGSDLIPELQREMEVRKSLMQFFSIILGVAVMALLALLD